VARAGVQTSPRKRANQGSKQGVKECYHNNACRHKARMLRRASAWTNKLCR
jgi:hypothetical protein